MISSTEQLVYVDREHQRGSVQERLVKLFEKQLKSLSDMFSKGMKHTEGLPIFLQNLAERQDAVFQNSFRMIITLQRVREQDKWREFLDAPLYVDRGSERFVVTSPGLLILASIIRSQGGWQLFDFHDLESAYQAYEDVKLASDRLGAFLDHVESQETVVDTIAKIVSSLVVTQNIIRGIYSTRPEIKLLCPDLLSKTENNQVALYKTSHIFGDDWERLEPSGGYRIEKIRMASMAIMSACRQGRSQNDADIEKRYNEILDSAYEAMENIHKLKKSARKSHLLFFSNLKLLETHGTATEHADILEKLAEKAKDAPPQNGFGLTWILLPKFWSVHPCERFLADTAYWDYVKYEEVEDEVKNTILSSKKIEFYKVRLTTHQLFQYYYPHQFKATSPFPDKELKDQFDFVVYRLGNGSFVPVPLLEDILEIFARGNPQEFIKVHLHRKNIGSEGSKAPDKTFVLPKRICNTADLERQYQKAKKYSDIFHKIRELLNLNSKDDDLRGENIDQIGNNYFTKMVAANNEMSLLLAGYAAIRIVNFAIAHGDHQLQYTLTGSDYDKRLWQAAIDWAAQKCMHDMFFRYISQFNSSLPVLSGNPIHVTGNACHTDRDQNDKPLFLGIDIGGSAIKIQAFTRDSHDSKALVPIENSFHSFPTANNEDGYSSVDEFCRRIISEYSSHVTLKVKDFALNKNLVGVGVAWPGAVKETETDNYVAATSGVLRIFKFIENHFAENIVDEIHQLKIVERMQSAIKKIVGVDCLVRLVNDGVSHVLGYCRNSGVRQDTSIERLALIAGTGTAIGLFNRGSDEPDTKILSEGGKYGINIQYPYNGDYPQGLANALFSRSLFEAAVVDDLRLCWKGRPFLEPLVVDRLFQNKENMSSATFSKDELSSTAKNDEIKASLNFWKEYIDSRCYPLDELLNKAANNLADVLATVKRLHKVKHISIGGGPVSGNLGSIIWEKAMVRLTRLYGYLVVESEHQSIPRKRCLVFPSPKGIKKIDNANTGCLGAASALVGLIQSELFRCSLSQIFDKIEEDGYYCFTEKCPCTPEIETALKEKKGELGITLRYDVATGRLERVKKVESANTFI